jgi:hypothetical protein
MIFSSIDEIRKVLSQKIVSYKTIVAISPTAFPGKSNLQNINGLLLTNVGKILLNDFTPSSIPYFNNAKFNIDIDDIVPYGTNVVDKIKERISSGKIPAPLKKNSLSDLIAFINTTAPADVAK